MTRDPAGIPAAISVVLPKRWANETPRVEPINDQPFWLLLQVLLEKRQSPVHFIAVLSRVREQAVVAAHLVVLRFD